VTLFVNTNSQNGVGRSVCVILYYNYHVLSCRCGIQQLRELLAQENCASYLQVWHQLNHRIAKGSGSVVNVSKWLMKLYSKTLNYYNYDDDLDVWL